MVGIEEMVGIEDCENEDRRMMNLGLLRFIDAACQAYSHVTRIILNRARLGDIRES